MSFAAALVLTSSAGLETFEATQCRTHDFLHIVLLDTFVNLLEAPEQDRAPKSQVVHPVDSIERARGVSVRNKVGFENLLVASIGIWIGVLTSLKRRIFWKDKQDVLRVARLGNAVDVHLAASVRCVVDIAFKTVRPKFSNVVVEVVVGALWECQEDLVMLDKTSLEVVGSVRIWTDDITDIWPVHGDLKDGVQHSCCLARDRLDRVNAELVIVLRVVQIDMDHTCRDEYESQNRRGED